VIGVLVWAVDTQIRHGTLVRLLRAGQLQEARTALNARHDWGTLLKQIQRSHDPRLVQAAFDVQFENWYSPSEDTHFSYREHPEVIAQLLALGAVPRFKHLLQATQQNKSQVAWLLLRLGVPASQTDTDDTPLANAAYWGDVDLAAELLRRGADINQPFAKGWRPVLAAAWSGKAACVRFLLDRGADVSLPYEVSTGNVQPIWKVIEERAAMIEPTFGAVWQVVRERIPAPAG